MSTAVGTVGVFGALIFAALQARSLGDQLALSNQQNQRAISLEQTALDIQLMELMMDVDHVFIDRPGLRQYFLGGERVPDAEPDRAQVLAVAGLILDLADSAASARRHGHMADEDYLAWRDALQSYFRSSPAIQLVWSDLAHCYAAGTAEMLGAPQPGLDAGNRPAGQVGDEVPVGATP